MYSQRLRGLRCLAKTKFGGGLNSDERRRHGEFLLFLSKKFF